MTIDKAIDTFRGNLSAVKTMEVEPGVLLKEFNNDEKKGLLSKDRPGYVAVSGGDF